MATIFTSLESRIYGRVLQQIVAAGIAQHAAAGHPETRFSMVHVQDIARKHCLSLSAPIYGPMSWYRAYVTDDITGDPIVA